MPAYSLNPYVSFIENRLTPGVVQRAMFHRLTGEILEYDSTLRADSPEVGRMVQRGFVIPEGYDPLAPFLDQYVARPVQNPALAYRSKTGEWILVRTSMERTVYSPRFDELPVVVEEKLSPLAADILLQADGTRTLRQLLNENSPHDPEFKAALDFLTSQERQLIKFTARPEDLGDPFTSVNIIPRNHYHSERKDQPQPDSANETIVDFHLHGIEDAGWEFDFIEPTVNHCYRFPHEALGGLDYGSRFCLSTLTPKVVPALNISRQLEVLEVGGGTGSFARAFITQAATKANVNYHILDLSPALMKHQRKILAELLPESSHFHQDATRFDLPDQRFDLIVSNEVIADFPVASVQRAEAGSGKKWTGEGAEYVEKYHLPDDDAPDSFLVNAGVFRFLERAWKHLKPGGSLVVSEYGGEQQYPIRSVHLNHDEYSIHFGHVAAAAAKIGFQCRLLTLKEFLDFDDTVSALDGREEHLLCLNHVCKDYGEVVPYAVFSQRDFEKRCAPVVEQTGLIGYSFSPIFKGYHYGPNIKDFFVLLMNKPQ
jgi:SAM-dependent methyltransferase